MKKRTRLSKSEDVNIVCHSPLPDSVIKERDKEYPALSDVEFRKKYRDYLFTPAIIEFPNAKYEIQLNFCNDTFCGWYGLSQKEYKNIKHHPSRYKMVGGSRTSEEARIYCNEISSALATKYVSGHVTFTISNWSVAEEIKRLIAINGITPLKPQYTFHREGCANVGKTPFENKECFRKRGKSQSNSTKYQCYECMKITNVMPGQEGSFNYHQQRNDILMDFCNQLLSRTPVKRICENLGIGSQTFYGKLEWLYKKCLEFNFRYETKPLSDMHFGKLWLNTDMMVYNLNNIRQKGKGGNKPLYEVEKMPSTYIVSSTDLKSGYAFRSDVAYDFDVSLDQIEQDTMKYHCDHSYNFLRKNDRLRYPYCPQPPTENDTQSQAEYYSDHIDFENRKNYVEGCHVKPQYTAMAHYMLLLWQLNVNEWYFVSDDDSTIQSCIFKVFSEKFRDEKAMYFTSQYEKELTLKEAGKQSFLSRIELQNWANSRNLKTKGIWSKAKAKLEYDLATHKFYGLKNIDGVSFPVRGDNPIKHPLPDKDEGIRWVNLISYIDCINNKELADLLLQVNSRAVNNFFQQVRRRISILERPLTSTRGEGKSYIYANYNPKYAQMALTIFRTFYNFCWKRKYGVGLYMTPAQRLGITEKVFEYEDIVYFR